MKNQLDQIQEQRIESFDYSNACSLFLYGMSRVTREYHLRRQRIFFDHIKLPTDESDPEYWINMAYSLTTKKKSDKAIK